MALSKFEQYQDEIQRLVNEFNSIFEPVFERYGNILTPDWYAQYQKEVKNLTKSLYESTENYLREEYGAENFKLIQLFRHGECTEVDKGLGFKPNANINSAANENMNHFDYSSLVHNTNPTTNAVKVLFSTMTRATVTAAHFVENLSQKGIQVFAKSSRKITEIAEGPSGVGIEKKSDYVELLNPFSGVKLQHRLMLAASFVGFGLTGKAIKKNKASKAASVKIIEDNTTIFESDSSPGHNHSSEVNKTKDCEREYGLANEIIDSIKDSNNNPGDVIVVGHGNSIRDTLTKFFPNYANQHRKKDALNFAENQSLMVFEVDGKKQLFMLPFRIQVDQHTPGKMNVRSVDYAELSDYYRYDAVPSNAEERKINDSDSSNDISIEEQINNGYEVMNGLLVSNEPERIIHSLAELLPESANNTNPAYFDVQNRNESKKKKEEVVVREYADDTTEEYGFSIN
ncbi:hypothetical protein LEAN103870_02445 [Legionella anisa]|uniref:Phosphoglycerate mutase n=1 Tax=Legionella anisa TaxID=28082 RepID=A0AAX0WT56_9GAMM|nr:hypothetical protein [Legionella anisa]AWN74302.1 hypothetical protein DLD14_10845 [Legionella anisa]KTC72020.1 coiled-coil protein [Legionella anisa]MBN5934253.1 hypothetical protein [Legionella anisa]MCW8425663.1 hypothetical protein [Legionella anisa]MCW8448908.1 hypothetical protein [Legionella anisa]